MPTVYYPDLRAGVPVVAGANGPVTFSTPRTYRGAVGVHITDISRDDGRVWAQTMTRFALVDGNGNVMLQKSIAKNWGADPGWVWLSGGLGGAHNLYWRIGIEFQATAGGDFLLGWSTIRFDARYQY
ncbi:hypothetical protein E4U02_13805 [Microbacterium paludicola]|uniref:Uncharacterized protein n=1 Tax=Microbacterium paludicola TaxID=300019 RepID=A0A4Y9FP83_9MICO|nr:hypothetical protein [Microbacterium paludicola]MBF0817477.1 hypothetical protein [Microbacterium paludicola]TFU31025.1 hypothetical protein E4U02_13805 [Microbacterium paludicola]